MGSEKKIGAVLSGKIAKTAQSKTFHQHKNRFKQAQCLQSHMRPIYKALVDFIITIKFYVLYVSPSQVIF